MKRYHELFQKADVAREGEVCKSHFIKGNIVPTRNFSYILVKRGKIIEIFFQRDFAFSKVAG